MEKGSTVYIRSASSVLAEYSGGTPANEYVYSGSSLLATLAAGAIAYHHPDHLSPRLDTDVNVNGNQVRTNGSFPFGDAWYETGSANKWKLTSYERDTESGLGYAIARSYSNRLGRFMSADLLSGQVSDPQSLNHYAYVTNDPINATDPLGLLKPGPCGVDGLLCSFDPCFFSGLFCGGSSPDPTEPPDKGGVGGGGGRTRVNQVLKKIQQAIDPKCLAFLASGNSALLQEQGGVPKLIDTITNQNLIGVDNLTDLPTAAAATSIRVGEVDTVNSEGAFFNSTNAQGQTLTVDNGRLQGGSDRAQAFILLHELGHLTGSLVPDHGTKNDASAGRANDNAIDKHCKDTLKQFNK